MTDTQPVRIPAGSALLDGDLSVPAGAGGLVVFAHGSGSSRHSPRNQEVAADLQRAGLATLLFDLLTTDEERVDQHTRHLRFDIPLLAQRLVDVTAWAQKTEVTNGLSIGYFGASTGAAAALIAAARMGEAVAAVVSRGGRPDLAGTDLAGVRCPVLLIVGGADGQVLALNRRAAESLADVTVEVVEGAGHLFSEAGALEQVSALAAGFMTRHLASGST
ncbi:MAG TPA: alpha/beta family hydrolase [Egibacteraceae bacterium]|nr:alpha/beta family hydrolase [Egibacteraceae bacterium]